MNKAYLYLLGILLLPISVLIAQESDLKIKYNELTYNKYVEKDWDGLISIAKESISLGEDFYYLRLRMGIAYAEKANYRLAIVNYQKAIEFVPADPIAQEYLYYAYLNAGMKNTASVFASKLPIALRKKIKPEKPSTFSNIYMETGLAFANYKSNNIVLPNSSSIYFSETFLREWQSYFNSSLMFNIAKPLSMTLAYTGLAIQSSHQFQIAGEEAIQEDVPVKQRDFYTSFAYHTDDGLSIIPFFHNVNTSMTYTEVKYDTALYATLEEGMDIDFISSSLSLKWNDPVVGIGIYKKLGVMDYAASFSYSWLGTTEQQQLSGFLTYLPKGNYSLFFTPEVRLLRADKELRTIFKFSTGATLSPKMWTSAAFTYGDLQNSHENFGGIVYNLQDKTKYKADASLHYGFSNGVSLSLRYQFTQKESPVVSNSLQTIANPDFDGSAEISPTITEWVKSTRYEEFSQHFIIFGFNWAI